MLCIKESNGGQRNVTVNVLEVKLILIKNNIYIYNYIYINIYIYINKYIHTCMYV